METVSEPLKQVARTELANHAVIAVLGGSAATDMGVSESRGYLFGGP